MNIKKIEEIRRNYGQNTLLKGKKYLPKLVESDLQPGVSRLIGNTLGVLVLIQIRSMEDPDFRCN